MISSHVTSRGIRLNCSILGPDVTAVFSVKALLHDGVGKLKRLIKKEVENELNTPRLDIWKVSDMRNLFVIVNT